jgi:sterol 3beta-glucosyltransferase
VRAVWSSRVNKFRSQLGFNETAVPWGDGEGRRLLSLYSMSPGLTGRSVEEAPGFFFLPSSPSFQPSPELDAFLTEGEPAVVVTLGSMMVANSESTMRLLIDAVAPSGRRLVVQRGWAFLWREFDFLPPFVIMIDNVPHEWLFPRASVVIHHGGAGTTAACLRAGVPSIIIPFIFDHGFWAARTLAYGSTSGILPYRELSAEKLSHLLLDTFSRYSHYRAHALRAASMVRQEPGVAAAARQISEALTANLATRPGR